MGSELVKPDHLDRKAVVYVRQSTPHQVITNQESLKLQYGLSQRARELGWREADIDVIDSDLGQSGAGAAHRKGFKDLVARVTLGEVGLILSMDVTRLARNCSVGKAAACELAIKPCACFSVHCHRPRESVPDKESRDATDYALPQPTPLIVGN